MDPQLDLASKRGEISTLYTQIQARPNVLEQIDRTPYVTTPLHAAAAMGKTEFALEVMRLKPSFARKVNEEGFTPMDLALVNGHFKTVRALIKFDNDLIQFRGKDGKTPFHCAAGRGDIGLLDEFLTSCPFCIEDLTFQCETALHVAVKNNQTQALRFLFGWLHRVHKEDILNWKDHEGNTILHIAVRENQTKAVELLINNVDTEARNLESHTAMDIFKNTRTPNSEIGDILRGASVFSTFMNTLIRKRDHYLGLSAQHRQNEFASHNSNIVLVVAVLIATATYQAVLSPPGGYWQDDNNPDNSTAVPPSPNDDERARHIAGKMIMNSWQSSYFALLNTSAFCASVCTIVLMVMGLPFAFFLEAATLFVSCSYFVSAVNIFPQLDSPTLCLLSLLGTTMGIVHFLAFEVQRRLRDRCRVGKGLWRYNV